MRMFKFKEDHIVARRNSRDKHSFVKSKLFESVKVTPKFMGLMLAGLGLWVVSAASHASTISINAAENPNNVIQLDGELSATITHTAQGIAIEIPGVEITLVCPSAGACTATIGDGSGATGYGSGTTDAAGGTDTSSGSTDTGGNDSGSGGTDSSTSGSSGGALDLNELCGSPRPTEYNSLQITWDKYCPGYTPTDTSGDTGTDSGGAYGSGDTVGGSSGSDGTDDCPGVGYDCYNHGGAASPSNDVVSNATVFPNAGGRKVDNIVFQTDFGSAGRNASGGTVYIPIDKGSVVVAGMTMSSEQVPTIGRLSFGVTANQPVGAELRTWISEDPDGARVSNYCSYVGYAEGAIRFSMDGSRDCNLQRGGTYFVNMALCKSDRGDWDCRSVDAMTAEENATLVFEVKYN